MISWSFFICYLLSFWWFQYTSYTWSQDFQSLTLLSTAVTLQCCSNNGWHYSVSTKSQIFLLVTEQAATPSVSLRVIYKPKILQSSCQYLLLLLDSSPWAKVIRCGYQEDWQRNQQWVVNMLCATWRHCFDVAAALFSSSIWFAFGVTCTTVKNGIRILDFYASAAVQMFDVRT